LHGTITSASIDGMTKIAFVGAGSVVFTRQLIADLLGFPDLAGIELALHDIDAERLAVAEGTGRRLVEQLGTPATVTATLDRRAALAGADFVVNMIQVGGIDATITDLEVPARYGLRQTIGDTTGVGGVFRALRTFPVLEAILRDMREVCPDALLLNYTNPMAMNVWWASVVAPDIRTYGLCHSVNHQAWLLDWTADGQDLYPRLRDRIAADPELERRVRVEIFRRIGYYPTETSEHSSEYLPWFLRSDAQVERFRIEPLQYIGISRDNVAEFEQARALLAAGADLPLEGGASEYAPQIIHSVVTGTPREIHVNVPNAGLIDNLPAGAAVEVPALVDAAGVRPVPMGALPPQCAALNRTYLSVAELTIEAARTGDPRLVRQAVLVDGNASSSLTPDRIWDLCDELTAAHGDLLPEPLRVAVPASSL
jgi:alpha-galactosidase